MGDILFCQHEAVERPWQEHFEGDLEEPSDALALQVANRLQVRLEIVRGVAGMEIHRIGADGHARLERLFGDRRRA